ncbi:hypothetical protein BV22DRAFT_1022106 [Leucogyrophana mollusca]|uniref:Uncharacterized protein n=1 Tax=Leucogyrophana mollusca TaxID=85980 RepID=A0ACB8B439_9AGAM|nr:hypothetical protein BV22DRAFT_1022106 [Leucogyrophana mollusca]
MSLLWSTRKTRLDALLNSNGDEDEEGLALDRILHGQSVIGKTGAENWLKAASVVCSRSNAQREPRRSILCASLTRI